MTTQIHKLSENRSIRSICVWLCVGAICLVLSACSELEKPKTEPFYAGTAPPQKKEFRWSNGKLPKSLDPAFAAAAPETDVVRAIYEGLTDTDPKTLQAVPAIAEKWSSSGDFKTWTFTIRKDAKWSNGENVTAEDFVRSWTRIVALGDKVVHRRLLENISGAKIAGGRLGVKTETPDLLATETPKLPIIAAEPSPKPSPKIEKNANVDVERSPIVKPVAAKTPEEKFGVAAVNETTLKVTLREPDTDFPQLVAHPLFRPVYGEAPSDSGALNAAAVTNGAFQIVSAGPEGITLDRSELYWAKDKIEIERVRFVPAENAEKALEAYRRGEIDAITNINFEPLALKLLEPFDDFRRKAHSALNYYEFNLNKKPFDDRRVREALAIAIERERLTEIEMDGASRPALTFLPYDDDKAKKLVEDKERAKELLVEAGYDDGEDFPVIKLVINRNDTQQRIARSVVRMWKQNLNIDAVIEVKESADFEIARQTGDYDLVRRGVVLPTSDEMMSLTALFAPPLGTIPVPPAEPAIVKPLEEPDSAEPTRGPGAAETPAAPTETNEVPPADAIVSEAEALREIPAIPLYFPTSYSLVKPYINGFDINSLDAPSLKGVRIDNNWQPKKQNGES